MNRPESFVAFYAVCYRGTTGGLRLEHANRNLAEVRHNRAADKEHPPEVTAVYFFDWGEKPKYIEGTQFIMKPRPIKR